MLRLLATIFLFGFLAVPAAAATISETDFAGGFGSTDLANPTYTPIGTGFDVVNGTIETDIFDFIQFTDLMAGAQTISFTFNMITPNGNANSNADGEIQFAAGSPSAFLSGGTYSLQSGRNVSPTITTATLSFNLDSSFAGGNLFVNVLPTSGNRDVAYSLSVPGNLPAAVPLPATGSMLALLLGGLAWRRRARRAHLHQPRFAAT